MTGPDTFFYNWRNKLILIAEDDYYSYHLLKEILKYTKCNIIHTLDGVTTFTYCMKNPSIDLVLLDIKLPKLDGYDTVRLIKKYRPHIPVIAQTAHAMMKDKERCLKFGCDEYFAKPFTASHLLQTMDKYLGMSSTGRIKTNVLLV